VSLKPIEMEMHVREVFLDSDNIATVILNGASGAHGPITVFIKGTGLGVNGIVIEETVWVSITEKR